MEIKYSEQACQDAVYIHCALKNHELIVPNSCVFAWEADVVSVTRAGLIHEFEIKITRADFKADAKKDRARILIEPTHTGWGGTLRTHSRPNYFYYTVPEGLIQADEIPSYAGLIYVKKDVVLNERGNPALYYGTTEVVKTPSRLHKDKITDWQRCQLGRALTLRFWRQRLRQNGNGHDPYKGFTYD